MLPTLLLLLQLLQLTSQVAAICMAPSPNWDVDYLSSVGVCAYTQKIESRNSFNFSGNEDACHAAVGTPGVTRLVRVQNAVKKFELFYFLLRRSIGYSRTWTEAICNLTTSRYQWTDGSLTELTESCNSTQSRIYVEMLLDADRQAQFVLRSTSDVSQGFVPVCEYDVPQCDPTTQIGYVAERMRTSTAPYPNITVKFECKPGFFRQEEIASEDETKNTFFCQHQSTPAPTGSATFQPVSNAVVEACKPIHCLGRDLLNNTLPDVNQSFISTVNLTKEYAFGESIEVDCKLGFVNYRDDRMANSSFDCGQNDRVPSLGMWLPPSLVTCFALKCKEPMPFYDVTEMYAYKAFDRIKDRKYTDGETNRFPYYPNVVHIRCRQSGYFFLDRKYDKTIQCSLPSNDSRTIGVWKPVDGTVLSSDIMRCKQITCLTTEIVITTQQANMLQYLQNGNFNNTLVITTSDNKKRNVTIKEFTELSDLPYNEKVQFSCNHDHEMSSTNAETGRLESVPQFEVTCSPSGTWSSKISACIKRTASILTGDAKRYVPPAKEAEGAQSLGVVVIVILVVFFGTILILDLTTITRDIKLLKKNLRRIRIKMKRKSAD